MSAPSGTINPVDRQHLVSLISLRTGLPQADAEKRLDDTLGRYRGLKLEAEQKAREVAETARRGAVIAAFLAAGVSLVGLLAAIWGASVAGTHLETNRQLRVFGQERFW